MSLQMAGILNKTTDPDFQADVSEKIIEVLYSQVLGLSQIITILNPEKNSDGELSDGEIVKILDNLVKEGRICSREINSQASKKTVRIYWLSCLQNPVCNSSPVSRAKISTVKTSVCATPKSNSTLRGRSGRYHSPSMQFVSPVLKRSCNEGHEGNMSTPKRTRFDKDDEVSSPQSAIQGYSEDRQLLMEKRDLKKRIQDKEDSLRKLNLVKIHRIKNDLKELQVLIDKWRNVSQDAAERLLSKVQFEPRPTMGHLLSNLQVDKQLIHYCENDEGFY